MPRKPKKERDLLWGDGTIRKRTSKRGVVTWQARWWEEGPYGEPVRRAKTFRTELDAVEHLRKIRIDRQAGRFRPESRITVEQLLAEYMTRPARNWKANTRVTYEIYRDRLVLPDLGSRRASELTTHQIQQWVDRLARRKLSSSAISNALSLLSGALKEAAILEVLPRNAAIGVKVPPKPPVDRVTWDEGEIRRVLDTVADDPMRSALYQVMIHTGMRPGEMRALKWTDVIIRDGITALQVERTITRDESGRQVIGTTTKTSNPRIVVVPEVVATALERWQAVQIDHRRSDPTWIEQDIIFDRGDGHFLSNESLQNIHRATVKAASVPKIRLHDIRHTYATLADEYGASIKMLSTRMGHKNSDMTLQYTHVSMRAQRAVAEAFAHRLRGEPDTTTSAPDATESVQTDARMGTRGE